MTKNLVRKPEVTRTRGSYSFWIRDSELARYRHFQVGPLSYRHLVLSSAHDCKVLITLSCPFSREVHWKNDLVRKHRLESHLIPRVNVYLICEFLVKHFDRNTPCPLCCIWVCDPSQCELNWLASFVTFRETVTYLYHLIVQDFYFCCRLHRQAYLIDCCSWRHLQL